MTNRRIRKMILCGDGLSKYTITIYLFAYYTFICLLVKTINWTHFYQILSISWWFPIPINHGEYWIQL